MAVRFVNEKHYRKLSKKERRQFRVNSEKYDKGRFKFILKHPSIKDTRDMIEFGFSWPHSPEGSYYWNNVATRFN